MSNLPPPNNQSSPPPPPPYAPPGFQQPTYVIQHQAKYGIGGWLAFFLVCFVLSTLSYAGASFALIDADDVKWYVALFVPLLAVASLASVILIAMKKQLGRWAAIATTAIGWLFTVVSVLDADGGSGAGKASGIVIPGLVAGAFALYWIQSDRVKNTLIK